MVDFPLKRELFAHALLLALATSFSYVHLTLAPLEIMDPVDA